MTQDEDILNVMKEVAEATPDSGGVDMMHRWMKDLYLGKIDEVRGGMLTGTLRQAGGELRKGLWAELAFETFLESHEDLQEPVVTEFACRGRPPEDKSTLVPPWAALQTYLMAKTCATLMKHYPDLAAVLDQCAEAAWDILDETMPQQEVVD